MSFITGVGLKEGSIVFGIISSMLLGGMSLGKQTQALADTKDVIGEVKVAVKENQDINVKQTIALTEQAIILKHVSKNLEKIEKKLDQ